MSALSMWTVYDHPRDYPDVFVARRYEVTNEVSPTEDVMVSPTLMPLREALAARGLTPLMRSDDDDPVVIEVWL